MIIFEDTSNDNFWRHMIPIEQPTCFKALCITLMKDPTNHFDYFLIDCFSVILYVCYSPFRYPVWTWSRRCTEVYWDMIFFKYFSLSAIRAIFPWDGPSVTKVIDIPLRYSLNTGCFRISYTTFLNSLRVLTRLCCDGNRPHLQSKILPLLTLKYTWFGYELRHLRAGLRVLFSVVSDYDFVAFEHTQYLNSLISRG